MSKQAEIQQAEWIVKTYNDYEKDVCRNDTVNIWVYEQKLKLIEEKLTKIKDATINLGR